jgi:hypothetical protein
VKSTWSNLPPTFNYTNVYPFDGPANINNGGTPVSNGQASLVGGTPAPSGTSVSNTSSSSGLSTGAKAGIGVGVPLAALGLAGVLLWLWKHKKESLRKESLRKESLPPELEGEKIYEADGSVKPSELEAAAPIHELSSEQPIILREA